MGISRYAVVTSGVVDNVVNWNGDSSQWQPPQGSTAVRLPDDSPVGLGYTYDGTTFRAPGVAPEPVPETVSRAELYAGCLLVLSQTRSVIDAAVETIIAAIPDETERSLASIFWADESHPIRRDLPLLGAVAAALQVPADQVDRVFVVGSSTGERF